VRTGRAAAGVRDRAGRAAAGAAGRGPGGRGPLPHAMPPVALRGEGIPYGRMPAGPGGGAADAPPQSPENPAKDHHKR